MKFSQEPETSEVDNLPTIDEWRQNKDRKSVIIWQPYGLGDCIFSQGVAQHYISGGYKVYWPVKQMYLTDLRRAYPTVNWLSEDFYHGNDPQIKWDLLHATLAPLYWSSQFQNVAYKDVMKAKYSIYGLDWTKWREHAQWKRDVFKEQELMEMNNINPGDRFNLISRNFGGGSFEEKSSPIPEIVNGLKTTFLKKIEGFSLFDWAPMMAAATQLHFAASSNIYLLEMMDLKAEQIHIYPRTGWEDNHDNYNYIMTRHKYIFH